MIAASGMEWPDANRKLHEFLGLVRELRQWARTAQGQIKAGRPTDDALHNALLNLASLAAACSVRDGSQPQQQWYEIPHTARSKFIIFAADALTLAGQKTIDPELLASAFRRIKTRRANPNAPKVGK